MLRVFNNTARYVDQGGGKRKGTRPHQYPSSLLLSILLFFLTNQPPSAQSALVCIFHYCQSLLSSFCLNMVQLTPPFTAVFSPVFVSHCVRLHRGVPRAMACGHHWVPRLEEEPRQWNGKSEGSILRHVDTGSIHEKGGAERHLVRHDHTYSLHLTE